MRIIAIGDIHNRLDYPPYINSQLQAADLILKAGDITNFGDQYEANQVLDRIAMLNDKILAVSGNCDRPGVTKILTDRDINLHAVPRIVEGIMFFGIGGCNKTPFHTPQEYTDDEMKDLLKNFRKKSESSKQVLVTHAPPHKTKLDKIFLGLHVGSKVIREFIDDFQPDLAVCGHIHEARGVDRIGKTLAINPGPFPRHYALIEVGTNIEYELY